MKRFRLLVASIIAALIIFPSTAYANYNPKTTGIQYAQSYNGMIYTNVPNAGVEKIAGWYNSLPEFIRELFNQEGVRFYYTEGVSLEARAIGGGAYAGACTITPTVSVDGNRKVISVNSPIEIYLYPESDYTSFLHECGHAIDYMASYKYGYYNTRYGISDNQEWINRLSIDYTNLALFDVHAMNHVPKNAHEAFAEAFRLDLLYDSNFYAACPNVSGYTRVQLVSLAIAGLDELTVDNFDADRYAAMYPDVAAAFGNDRQALFNHYQNYGKAEGRQAYRRNSSR